MRFQRFRGRGSEQAVFVVDGAPAKKAGFRSSGSRYEALVGSE